VHQSCQQFYRPTQWTGKLKYFFIPVAWAMQGLSIDAEPGFEHGAASWHPTHYTVMYTWIWWTFFRHKAFAQKKCSLDLLISTIMNNFLLLIHLTSGCEILHPPFSDKKCSSSFNFSECRSVSFCQQPTSPSFSIWRDLQLIFCTFCNIHIELTEIGL
jgi:hypothetical protein